MGTRATTKPCGPTKTPVDDLVWTRSTSTSSTGRTPRPGCGRTAGAPWSGCGTRARCERWASRTSSSSTWKSSRGSPTRRPRSTRLTVGPWRRLGGSDGHRDRPGTGLFAGAGDPALAHREGTRRDPQVPLGRTHARQRNALGRGPALGAHRHDRCSRRGQPRRGRSPDVLPRPDPLNGPRHDGSVLDGEADPVDGPGHPGAQRHGGAGPGTTLPAAPAKPHHEPQGASWSSSATNPPATWTRRSRRPTPRRRTCRATISISRTGSPARTTLPADRPTHSHKGTHPTRGRVLPGMDRQRPTVSATGLPLPSRWCAAKTPVRSDSRSA